MKEKIIKELRRILIELDGGKKIDIHLLSIICSYGDTLSDENVYEFLKDWDGAENGISVCAQRQPERLKSYMRVPKDFALCGNCRLKILQEKIQETVISIDKLMKS